MTTPRWLDDDQQRAWRAYLRMQGRLSAALNRQLQTASGLSLADYDVLVHLTDAPEGGCAPTSCNARSTGSRAASRTT
nr:hypothetical protein GCM10020093_017190 [Planobispora longispora]